MVTPTPETPKPVTGWARWRGPVLFVSLGLNLFLVGAMAGGWWHQHQGRGWRHHMGAQQMGQMARPGEIAGTPMRGGMAVLREAIQQLPEAERKLFEDSIAQRRADVQQLQTDIRQARMKVNEAIRAEPFDRKAMADGLAVVRDKVMAMQAKLHEGFVEGVSKLPADKRRDFADKIANLRQRP
jgi:uncharacterized membrane protein